VSLSIVILAAGQGTRMRSSSPKVLQPLAGQPLLAHVIECSKSLGASDICVVYGFGGDLVRAAFDRENIRWALQQEQLGTGHAVMQAMADTPDDNRVLILFGDVPLLQRETLQKVIDACSGNDVAVLTVDMDDPTGYGRIVRENGRVVRNVEEKDANEAERAIREINTGVQTMPAAKLKEWLSRLGNNNSQGEYYLTDVLEMAVADGVRVHGVKAGSMVEVMGINDRKQLASAERALQSRLVDELMKSGVSFADPARVDIRGKLECGRDVFIDVNAVFEGNVSLGDKVHIESNNVIRDSRIGAGTVIHPNCHIDGAATGPDCEIGPFARLRPGADLAAQVKVGNFVEIKKSTVADGSKVNHLTYIGDATIGKNVNVGAGTITCNYDGVRKHKTTIEDGVFVGSDSQLIAPVTVGRNAYVAAGSSITEDVPPESLAVARARQTNKPGWAERKRKE
jgi:bifunctional UDP-N-acetylglucosamine pyrophosphorylase/glucosamine-1-phosphate N-acetyltransferase